MKSLCDRVLRKLQAKLLGKLRWELDRNSYRWVVVADDEQMFVVKCFEFSSRWSETEVSFGQFIWNEAGELTIDFVKTTDELQGRDLGSTILAIGHFRNDGPLLDPDHELPGSEQFWENWRSPAGRKKIEKLAATVKSRTGLDI